MLISMIIREISEELRPRERLHRFGALALSETELLALILQKGTRNENVIELSNRLIGLFGEKLGDCTLSELEEVHGIGRAKACQIIAAFEFSRRLTRISRRQINCPEDVYLHCKWMCDLSKEHFVVLHLDSKNCVIREETVAIGTLNASIVHCREVFRSAIRQGANSIVLVHNHPSGDVKPSDEDVEVTKRLRKAGEMLGIKVVDHVVVGDGWVSVT